MHIRHCHHHQYIPAIKNYSDVLLAVVREVDSQIHEIILPPTRLVDNSLKHGLVDFVWDVSEHDLQFINSCQRRVVNGGGELAPL